MKRRHFLSMTSGLLLPQMAYASESNRKFLFVFCPGGWDQCYLFAPLFDSPFVDMEGQAQPANVQGIAFVDSEDRPSVRSFFSQYGQQCCFINGFEARSVAHDVCLRLMSTGSSLSNKDDWAAMIASQADSAVLMPSVHISGPSFLHKYGHIRAQLGNSGQLEELLQQHSSYDAQEDAWLKAILEERTGTQMYTQARDLEEKLLELQNLDLALSSAEDISGSIELATSLLAQGLARTVSIGYRGVRDLGWDTHAGNHMQGWHFEELFATLEQAMTEIDLQVQPNGRPLSEDLCIVLLSEMGRFPRRNFRDGKDHWTYTSCMLMGAGVRGGQCVGAYDQYCMGHPIDLQTGQASVGGTPLECGHIGATLLALADIDPRGFLDYDPITAVLAGQ